MRNLQLLLTIPMLLMAQNPAGPKEDAQMPCTRLTGVQATSITDSEGGGDYIVLQTEHGLIGPFLKLPSLPQGVGYGTTEVEVPAGPEAPCRRGQWAKDANYFYMCVAVSPTTSSTGTVWRRLAWDQSWQSTLTATETRR